MSRKISWAARGLVLAFGAALAFVTLSAQPAAAHWFGYIKMDDKWVDFASDEDNTDDYLFWNHFVHFEQLDQYDARTDLVATELPRWGWSQATDVVWFATDALPINLLGDETCRSLTSLGDKCDRARVRFNQSYSRDISENVGFWLACHEFGHAYGFEHFNDGCMQVGPNDQYSTTVSGVLSSHMIGHINAQY